MFNRSDKQKILQQHEQLRVIHQTKFGYEYVKLLNVLLFILVKTILQLSVKYQLQLTY